MRLWDYRLIPVLPNKMIVAEWRECIAIKRQWEKGTLKHRLVSYVMDYDKNYFLTYVNIIFDELYNRNIKFQQKYYDEIYEFCAEPYIDILYYPEHNDRYLKQCYYNLEEKADRGIISEEEWEPIQNFWDKFIKEKAIEENIYINPEIEIILPSSKIKGVQSVKIKLTNSSEKEIIIYPESIDFENDLFHLTLLGNTVKINSDDEIFYLKEMINK